MDFNEDALILLVGGVFLIFGFVAFVFFIIGAVARYMYCKVRGYEYSWMAFIPIANIWATVEATYGKVETINIYGWNAPAVVLKLWAIVSYVLTVIVNKIPTVGYTLSLILTVFNIAVTYMLFRDMMEKLEQPQSSATAIIAAIISIVGSIIIISAASKFQPGERDYRTDTSPASSQLRQGGVLSFLNGNK